MKRIAPLWKWLFLLVLAALAIAAAFHFDGAVRAWVTAHPSRGAKDFMRNVSHFGDWPEHLLLGLLIIGIAWWRGSKRWVRIGLTMLVALALAGVVARGVKIATGRARPSVKYEMTGWHGPRLSSRYNSFPSGHTAATIGFFGVLLFVRPRLGLCLLPIPLLIAASRMYVAAHYLSDVVVAAILGLFCAWLCARWLLPARLTS
ncbi:MAG: phosphatase PAP2 family protein [Chthoniobacterales bacterium]